MRSIFFSSSQPLSKPFSYHLERARTHTHNASAKILCSVLCVGFPINLTLKTLHLGSLKTQIGVFLVYIRKCMSVRIFGKKEVKKSMNIII